ncbi:ATP-binding cassette domain-containing protein [Spiroplasma turonicum]|uniref:ABC transporter domain-containing protein n=1 Tax=Spiroplasma turonicum TaxID=216946 RepID=A0A0K1P6H6_9MOLU|nr:ATP-binding cassette domain-containing protein [Spiroplasma turonicum]AKU79921.1 hypothetical protein STURON_00675 [Spiroplasma turonicum]ALX70934.1 ABC transporter ATP-binding protein [Spiroplasma turonicum]
MKENVIETKKLTKKYKNGYGIFDIDLIINYGSVFGYLGPNGAGKSTSIRALLGFIKPTSGNANILIDEDKINKFTSYDSWTDSSKVNRKVGYVPGEIAFPENLTGIQFIKEIYGLRKLDNWDYVNELIQYWNVDVSIKIKKLSKGNKQKIALITAWMHNPDIIILDEPTTGLDPLMQQKFIDLVNKSKNEGKAIILSSHVFSEIEKVCDNVAIIKQGKIISLININELQQSNKSSYIIKVKNSINIEQLSNKNINVISYSKNDFKVEINNDDHNKLIDVLSTFNVVKIQEIKFDLEDYFMSYYDQTKEKSINQSAEKTLIKTKSKKHNLFTVTLRKHYIYWLVTTLMTILFSSSILGFTLYSDSFISSDSDSSVSGLVAGSITSSTSFIFLIYLVHIIISGNSILVSEVEKGTLVNILIANQSRKSIILTKMFTLILGYTLSILLLFIFNIILILASSKSNSVDIGIIIINFLGLYLLLIALISIVFLCSSIFNKSAISLAVGGGLCVIFFFFAVLGQTVDSLKVLKYLSINSLTNFNMTNANEVSKYISKIIFLIIISISCYISSYFVFIKKDLHL